MNLKKLISIVLAAVMVFSLASITVSANNGPNSGNYASSWILLLDKDNKIQNYIYSCDDSLFPVTPVHGMSYDISKNTLTVNNIDGSSLYLITNEMGDDFKIEVIGENSFQNITVWGYGYGGSLEITGNGTIIINENRKEDTAISLFAEEANANLTVKSSVKLKAFAKDIYTSVAEITYTSIVNSDEAIVIEGVNLPVSTMQEYNFKNEYVYLPESSREDTYDVYLKDAVRYGCRVYDDWPVFDDDYNVIGYKTVYQMYDLVSTDISDNGTVAFYIERFDGSTPLENGYTKTSDSVTANCYDSYFKGSLCRKNGSEQVYALVNLNNERCLYEVKEVKEGSNTYYFGFNKTVISDDDLAEYEPITEPVDFYYHRVDSDVIDTTPGSNIFAVTVLLSANGSAAADKDEYTAGETVTITATPDPGFSLKEIIVQDGFGNDFSADISGNIGTFIMPDHPVQIKTVFQNNSGNSTTHEIASSSGNINGKVYFRDEVPDNYVIDMRSQTMPDELKLCNTESLFLDVSVFTNNNEEITDNFMTVSVILPDDMKDADSYSVSTLVGDTRLPYSDITVEDGVLSYSCDNLGKVIIDAYTNKFEDINQKAWYAEGVEYCVKKGYFRGTGETEFSPNKELTREQLMMIFANFANVNLDEYTGKSIFSDVPTGMWYSKAVKWAGDTGVTSGIGNGKFGLGQNVTREQLALLFMNYTDSFIAPVSHTDISNLAQFKDVDSISTWAKVGVSWSVENGLIGSVSTNEKYLSPQGLATRAQGARIMMVFDNLVSETN